jgi:HK97 family phage major capsid protein
VVARNHYVQNRNPSTPVELAQALSDPHRAAELFGGQPGAWEAFEAEYASRSPLVAKMAAEQGQLQLQQMLQDGSIPHGLGGRPSAGGKSRFYNKRAPGTALESVLPDTDYPLAQMVRVVNKRDDSLQPLRTEWRTQMANAMSERVPSEGGFLLPETLRSGLLELALEQSVIRQRALVLPMDSLRVPVPSIDDPSHVNSVYGGVQAFWTEEGAAMQQSAPSFSRVTLEAKKLTAWTAVPNELLQDNGEQMLQAWIEASWPKAISYYEDDAFINGTGVGEPQGFLSAPSAVKVATATSHAITLTDIISAYCRFLPQALPGAIWLCSPDVKEQLLQLAFLVTVGATTTPIAPPAWLSGLSAIAEEPSTLFGKPVFVSEKMPSSTSSNTTTAGALSLCNFSYYLLGDRAELALAMSEEYLFQNDLTAYRLIERLDARAWPQTALSPRNGGPTLSPFVLADTTS